MAPEDDFARLLIEGRYAYALYTQHLWISRRIETIEFLSPDTLYRSVSLEIDSRYIRQYAHAVGFFGNEEIYLPLGVLPKTLFLDLEITDRQGERLSFLESDEDARIATGLILAALEQAGVTLSDLSPSVLGNLRKITAFTPTITWDVNDYQRGNLATLAGMIQRPAGFSEADKRGMGHASSKCDLLTVVRNFWAKVHADGTNKAK